MEKIFNVIILFDTFLKKFLKIFKNLKLIVKILGIYQKIFTILRFLIFIIKYRLLTIL